MIVLVAVVTSVLAPPLLRRAMARIEQLPEEAERRERQHPQSAATAGAS
ncbi:hypothetical protein ABZ820_38380 [Streptomyces diacarni]